jgi:long-chain acyl-CoA synthetase
MSVTEVLTIPALLQATVASVGDREAIGIIRDCQLSWRTWREFADDVSRAMTCLRVSGVDAGDRVVQYGANSYPWIVTDLAILSMGAVHVPLHATLPKQQAAEQIELADAKLLIADEPRLSAISHLPIKAVASETLFLGKVIETEDLRGSPLAASPMPQDLATILFTSGTTGRPRGVMLSHHNLVTNAIATTEGIGSTHEETRLTFLPLSHIYARTCDLYTWIYRGSRLVLAENRETIVRDCQLVRPTVINGVPYFYQKVAQSLLAAGRAHESGALLELLGGQMRLCCCGGAAAAPEVEKLFSEQGLPLLPGYGLTEASPVISISSKENYKVGCVGPPIKGAEVKLADDGEVLVSGPNVMLGYWRDETATNQAIVDGWLHTGDLGEFDEGRLRIVGRKKELLALSTGKKVCPTAVEQRLAGSPYVETVCVVGDGRSHLSALIVPNPQVLQQYIKDNRLWVWSKHRAVTHPKVRELFRQEIDRLLAEAAHEEQVGPFVILTRNFSLEAGEVTPKFSLCRKVIAKSFAAEIEAMYR